MRCCGGSFRAESGYTVLVGDRHQREKCLSCVAVAASGGNQPVADLNSSALGGPMKPMSPTAAP